MSLKGFAAKLSESNAHKREHQNLVAHSASFPFPGLAAPSVHGVPSPSSASTYSTYASSTYFFESETETPLTDIEMEFPVSRNTFYDEADGSDRESSRTKAHATVATRSPYTSVETTSLESPKIGTLGQSSILNAVIEPDNRTDKLSRGERVKHGINGHQSSSRNADTTESTLAYADCASETSSHHGAPDSVQSSSARWRTIPVPQLRGLQTYGRISDVPRYQLVAPLNDRSKELLSNTALVGNDYEHDQAAGFNIVQNLSRTNSSEVGDQSTGKKEIMNSHKSKTSMAMFASSVKFRTMLKSSTPLIEAVKAKDLGHILHLLAPDLKPQPINGTDRDGWTALHWAARLGHAKIAKSLIDRNIAIEARTKGTDLTAVYVAAEYNNPATLRVLLHDGHAKVSSSSKMDGATALHKAAQMGYEECIGLLLHYGAEVNQRDVEGMPALMWATQGKQLHSAEILINAGADLEARIRRGANLELATHQGVTVLHKVVTNKDHAFARLFLEMGANPDADGPNGQRPLHKAAAKNDLVMLSMLLGFSADVRLLTTEGWTVLHTAARYGHKIACHMLLKGGADQSVKTKDGLTPKEIGQRFGFDGLF